MLKRRRDEPIDHRHDLSRRLWLALLMILVSSCSPPDRVSTENYKLAFHYAPVHFQMTTDTNYQADFITKIDYDGNWTPTDNWEHLAGGDLSAWVYYSVVESCTHWFIIYALYHPRDWSDNQAVDNQEHENDMEGLLAIVRNDGTEFGELLGIITVAHLDFYSFIPDGSPLTDGEEDIDGELLWQVVDGTSHPETIQETQGHPLKAFPYISDFRVGQHKHRIIYFPSMTTSTVPQSGDDRTVHYRLIDLTADTSPNLWFFQILDAGRPPDNATTFATWGTLMGDDSGGCGNSDFSCKDDAASAPWGWDDEDDAPEPGEMALDPAHLVKNYFGSLGENFSDQYLHNQYLEDLRDSGFGSDFKPRGWPEGLNLEDLYSKLTSRCP